MKCGSFQRNVSHLCLLRKLSAKWPPAPQQPRNLCSPGAARHNFSATHSGLQRTRSHRVTAFPAAVAVSSPQAKDGLCQCHIDPTHHHSRHSSRHIKMLSSGCCSHRVLCDHVACSRGSIHNHRIRAAAAPENPESAAHNGDDSRSEQASTQAAPTAATNLPPAPSDRNGGDGGQGRDSGDGGGQGSGKGGDAGGFGQQPKFPAWYTVWVWCTAVLYLVWRWQWRRDRRLAAEQFDQEQAAEEQLKQDWQNFAQQYKIQAGTAVAAGLRGKP